MTDFIIYILVCIMEDCLDYKIASYFFLNLPLRKWLVTLVKHMLLQLVFGICISD